MRTFIKWISILLPVFIVISFLHLKQIISEQRVITTYTYLLLVTAITAVIFTYFELKLIPARKEKLKLRLMQEFNAKEIHNGLFICRIGKFDVYIHLNIDFTVTLPYWQSGSETICFYIPQNQIQIPKHHPWFESTPEVLNGIDCYKLTTTGGWGLNLVRHRLNEFLSAATSLTD